MLRFRALLLWVVMFALPLQGYAAATMVFCGASQLADAGSTTRAHSDSHDHSNHQRASVGERLGNQSDAKAPSASPDTADTIHTCGACGICGACHVTALPSATLPSASDPLPPSRLADPFDAVATVTPRALDKPPRA